MLRPIILRRRAAEPRQMLAAMETIRGIEAALQEASIAGELEGPVHVSLGEEAVAVGVVAGMGADDLLLSNHRGHGHALAWGLDPVKVIAEIVGHPSGYCGGRGGSMHLFVPQTGFLGTNGIVGGNAGVALGAGLAVQMAGDGRVAVVIIGDGAMAAGIVYEAFNLAALWKLPIVFVCENNGYAEMTPTAMHLSSRPVERAAAFGLAAQALDGTDVNAVLAGTRQAVDAARKGRPGFIEAVCYRFGGHYAADPARYRPPGEDAHWQLEHCPIQKFSCVLGVAEADWTQRVGAIKTEARALIDELAA